MHEPLQITIEQCEETDILQLCGALSREGAAKLQCAALLLLEHGHRRLVIDFERVTFIDSAGIGVVLQLNAECRGNRGRLALAGAASSVADILRQITRSLVLKFYPDAHAARRDLCENVPFCS
jgi:anti-anti-sigma factor